MKLLFFSLITAETGAGHWFRAKTLAECALENDHEIHFLSNRDPEIGYHIPVDWLPKLENIYWTALLNRYDWVIVDMPEVPEYVFGCEKICLIDNEDDRANLCISQSLEGKYAVPEHLIIRPYISTLRIEQQDSKARNSWFVYGGSGDVMGLLGKFSEYMPDQKAIFPLPEFALADPQSTGKHLYTRTFGDSFLQLASMACNRAAVAFGVTVWELLALEKIVYAFSSSERHLETALQLDKAGYIRSWPKVGIPENCEAVRAFLLEPFTPTSLMFDFFGPLRILRLMEKYDASYYRW